ncbi:MAG: DMT family transporter [Rhodobacterales bacterium]|nr:DMT family transporter [Rhodobacterales bacterium]
MTRLQANAVLLVATMIWGATFTVQQMTAPFIGASQFTGSRFLLGALLVLPLALRQAARKRRDEGWRLTRRHGVMIGLTGVALFLGAVLQQIGIAGTTVANAGFLTGLYVPLTPLIALMVLRKPPHWAVWPAAAVCLAGVYVLSGGELAALTVGDLWVIGGALFWAIHILLVGTVAQATGAPLVVAVGQFAACAVLGLGWGLATEPVAWDLLPRALPGVLFAGLVSVGLGFTLQVVGQRHTPPADAAIILSAETVFAAITGAIVLGERLSPLELTGCAMILAGVLSVELLPLWAKGRRRAV